MAEEILGFTGTYTRRRLDALPPHLVLLGQHVQLAHIEYKSRVEARVDALDALV